MTEQSTERQGQELLFRMWQTFALKNEKKISQIINTDIGGLFYLFIILWRLLELYFVKILTLFHVSIK
jgi:hypothetical protein